MWNILQRLKKNKTFRYVDDNILIGSNDIEKNNFKNYPNSLNLKKLKKNVSYLDIKIEIKIGELITSIDEKPNTFNFFHYKDVTIWFKCSYFHG